MHNAFLKEDFMKKVSDLWHFHLDNSWSKLHENFKHFFVFIQLIGIRFLQMKLIFFSIYDLNVVWMTLS